MTTITQIDQSLQPTGVAGVARSWDGHAWIGDLVADPDAPGLPKWHRRPFAVLGHRLFWLWFGCFLAGIALAVGYGATRNIAFLAAAGVIGPGGSLLALAFFLRRRLQLHEVISRRAALGWGILAGVVAIVIAWFGEGWWGDLVGPGWRTMAIAGPAEETGKILVPVVLYLLGRYRDPRAGVALALVSGVVFGWAEGIEYLVQAGHPSFMDADVLAGAVQHAHREPGSWLFHDLPAVAMAIERPLVELMHPLYAVFIAAVAWRWAWVKHRFWLPLLGAWALAALLHSVNDMSTALKLVALGVFIVITLAAYYLLARPASKELVPPEQLVMNPPAWRPRVPPRGQQLPTLESAAG